MELTLDQALQKGIEAHKAGKVQEADRYYTAILKSNPNHPDANHNIGVLAVGIGKVETALPFFKTALEANPNISQFWLSYIDTLIKLEKLEDAKAVIEQAKSTGIKGDAFDQIEKRLGPSTSKNSNIQDPPKEQLDPLIKLYNQQKFQQVFIETQILTKKYSSSLTLWNLMGASGAQVGKLDEAVFALQKAINIKPDFANGYNNMGNVLKDQGKLGKAIEAYNTALSIKPDYAEVYNNMGNALKGQGKLDKATEAYEKAISIKPDYAYAYNNMGNAFTDQGKLGDAIEAYKKALAIKPDYAEASNNMGATLQEQGKLEEAIEAYNKALSIKPNYAEPYNNMGNTFQEQGKLEEAIEAYNSALLIRPNYTEAIINASALRNQISYTTLINEELEKKLETHTVELIKMPQFHIHQAVRAFIFNDQKLVRKYLNSYDAFTPSSIAKMKSKDQVFCSAYNHFVKRLIEPPSVNGPTSVVHQTVFHLGDSHCLSYAHKKIEMRDIDYTVAPRIIFGAKAFHFSKKTENQYKAITKANFHSLAEGSKVFLSFGEIDCRPNEGFISATSKLNSPIENIISDTVEGYVSWFAKQNESKNHSLFFFNVPAPVYDEGYTVEVNKKVKSVINLFNSLLNKTVLDYNLNIIDVCQFTGGHDGFSNGFFHIDNRHLSNDAIPEIEKQIGTFS